jgi:tripartite-type tricarboxylate transporter receptor subunit TctC
MEKSKLSFIFIRTILFVVFSFIFITIMGQDVLAIDWPTRPIKLVISYSPGGGTDLGSKAVAIKLSEVLGQPIISEYKPGAAGSLGATFAARAKPDGYTLSVGSQTPLVLSPLVKKLDYSLESFEILFGYSRVPLTIQVDSSSPWKNLAEFVADAKRNPGKYSYGTYGALGLAHIAMELLSKQAGIKLTHIPFAGSEKANAALMGKHVDIACTTSLGGLHTAGKIRVFAVAEKERFPTLKDVPTLTEQGYPVQLNAQYAFCAPKGIPEEIVAKIQDAQKEVFNKYYKELEDHFFKINQCISNLDYKEINQKYREDYKIIYKVAKEMGILVKK